MPRFEIAKITRSCGAVLEDRADIFEASSGLIFVVADGAGGVSGGSQAAAKVLDLTRQSVDRLLQADGANRFCQFLYEIDTALLRDSEAGESTAVILSITAQRITGASVGDSGAWLVAPDRYIDLTVNQRRKPLLGTGRALAEGFTSSFVEGTLLVATDGLFKYAESESICRIAHEHSVTESVEGLVNLVRLQSGELQDDVAIILARRG